MTQTIWWVVLRRASQAGTSNVQNTPRGCALTRDFPNRWRSAIPLASLSAALFVALAVRWGFVLTAASDPLEYVGPALNPDLGFPYPDRLALWLWLRLFALLPLPPEWIGPVATLTQTALIQFITVAWLGKRVSLFAGALFGTLYISAPIVTSIATYTYPMQMMTLLILVAGIVLCELQSRAGWMSAGALVAVSVLAKIQAVGIAVLLILKAFGLSLDWRRVSWLAIGGILGTVVVLGVVVLLDGPGQVLATFDRFLNDGFAEKQYVGRAAGDLPPFWNMFRDPTVVIGFGGVVLAWMGGGPRERLFASFAFAQVVSLIGIYIITDRGGPLITNYFFDAVVFGLVAFAAYVGSRVPFGVTASVALLGLGFVAAEVGAQLGTVAPINLADTSMTFSPLIDTVQGHLDIVLLVGCAAVACSRWWQQAAFRTLAAACFGLMFFLAMLFAGKGPLHASFDRSWSVPYHQMAHTIMSGAQGNCLATLGGTDLDRWRVLWLLDYLYQWPGIEDCGGWDFPT